jgi:WXG100 family type VII secretion target
MAGTGQFRTELPTMQAGSQHVFQVNANIQGQLSGFIARLEPVAAQWQGEAATSFQQLKNQWHQSATRLNTALQGIGDALVANTSNYAQSEDQNRQGFTGISSVLG